MFAPCSRNPDVPFSLRCRCKFHNFAGEYSPVFLFLTRWKYRATPSQTSPITNNCYYGRTPWTKFPDGTCWPLNCKISISLYLPSVHVSTCLSSAHWQLNVSWTLPCLVSTSMRLEFWLLLLFQVLTSHPYTDPQYGGMFASYRPQAMVWTSRSHVCSVTLTFGMLHIRILFYIPSFLLIYFWHTSVS